MEVVIGRAANEKSVLKAANKARGKLKKVEADLTKANINDKAGRELLGKTVHAVIERGQLRQIESYRKR